MSLSKDRLLNLAFSFVETCVCEKVSPRKRHEHVVCVARQWWRKSYPDVEEKNNEELVLRFVSHRIRKKFSGVTNHQRKCGVSEIAQQIGAPLGEVKHFMKMIKKKSNLSFS